MARFSRFLLAAGLLPPNMAWAAPDGGSGALVALLLVLAIALLLYFLPAIIGSKRQVNNSGWLFAANLLLGWSGLGWIACLLWAVCGQTQAEDAYWRRQPGP